MFVSVTKREIRRDSLIRFSIYSFQFRTQTEYIQKQKFKNWLDNNNNRKNTSASLWRLYTNNPRGMMYVNYRMFDGNSRTMISGLK